ncbi:MAG: hypothetical protein KJ947_17950 [Alphaproteobacteria bacterium]|jgi:uncharacterized phosphosugar-binding protein|nr:hypothetical protein [Alphaproteobacteria bacterium]MBU1551443.1 hypothetical protein [Alphaproteobacteria bacterium]MBU2334721.1 hypothetical protein [Alphaproteobacteria bacterium]MBU2386444.1 hypothetical protein [Alphaproteobacteria bacterium]
MPKYFFHHVTKAGQVRDLEGSELPDLDHARTEAVLDARSLMSDAIRQGRDISSRSIQISDEQGTVLLTVLFADTVTRDD